jgi:hypothetical protein
MSRRAVPIVRAGWIAASLMVLAGTAPVAGQVCLGRPIGGLAGHALVAQTAYAVYDLDERVQGADLGAEYWGNPRGFAAYSAGYTRRFMREGGPDLNIARARLVAELPRIPRLPPGAGACLTAGASGAWAEDAPRGANLTAYAFPLGVAVGMTVPAGATSRVYPYLHPRVAIARGDGEALGFDFSERYTALLVEAGMGYARGPLVGRLRLLLGRRPDGAGIGPIPDLRAGIEAGIRF